MAAKRQLQSDENVLQQKRDVTDAAFRVALGGLFSMLAGFGSQVLIATLFGTRGDMDAYLTALTIPLYLEGVLLSGLAFVLIPAFVERVETDRADEAWALVGTFFRLIGLVMLPLSLALSFFASSVIELLAPGLSVQKAELAAALLSVLAFSSLFNGYRAFAASIENARGRFFVPAVAGAVSSVVQIAVVLLLYRRMGIMALAVGFVAAMFAQAAVTTIPVLRHGWQSRLPLHSPDVRRILWLVTPFVLLGLVTSLTPVLERYFASSLPDGELSYLGYAHRIAMIFQSLIGGSIVTAIFPQLTRSLVQGGIATFLATFHYAIRLTMAVAFPIVAVGSVLAAPMIASLFERGAFDNVSTLGVAAVIPLFLVKGVLFVMVGNLLTRVFYVVEDTRTVPVITVASVLLYWVLAAPAAARWGYLGLAAIDMARAGIAILVMIVLIFVRYRYWPWRTALATTARYGMLAFCAGAVAWVAQRAVGPASSLTQLTVGGTSAVVVYLTLLHWLDPSMSQDVLGMVGIHRLRQLQAGILRRSRAQMT